MADVLAVTGLAFGIWALISLIFQVAWLGDDERIKTNTNFFAMLVNAHKYITGIDWKEKFTPKSAIDKEIAEEENEIEELERQKEKINQLHSLKRRKAELFEQIERSSE